MIEIQNVCKRYGSVHALHDVSFTAKNGAVVGLLGQNGAGKSTLLNIVTGYLAPTSGNVLLSGHDPLLAPQQAKRLLGYMPEHPPLYDEMTVEEYLRFVSCLREVHPKAVPEHIDEIIDKTGLSQMRHRLLGHLSKGYRQRAGMAQALCGDPEIIVMDEPTAGLDPKQITEIRTLIRSLSKGRTILFSSHMLAEVQQLCDTVVILHQGRVRLNTPLSSMNASCGEVVLFCTLAESAERLTPALRELPGLKKTEILSSSNEEETAVQLTFHHQLQPERVLFSLACELAIPILRLSRQEDSLEKLFLQTISEA